MSKPLPSRAQCSLISPALPHLGLTVPVGDSSTCRGISCPVPLTPQGAVYKMPGLQSHLQSSPADRTEHQPASTESVRPATPHSQHFWSSEGRKPSTSARSSQPLPCLPQRAQRTRFSAPCHAWWTYGESSTELHSGTTDSSAGIMRSLPSTLQARGDRPWRVLRPDSSVASLKQAEKPSR